MPPAIDKTKPKSAPGEIPAIFHISKRGDDAEKTTIFLRKSSGDAIYLVPGRVTEIYYNADQRITKIKFVKWASTSYSRESSETTRDIIEVSLEEHNELVKEFRQYLFDQEFTDRL